MGLFGGCDKAPKYPTQQMDAQIALSEKLGNRFMDLSENFINGVDLENGVFELDGLSMLEEWEKGDTMKFLDQGPIKYSQVTSLPEGELIEAHNNNYKSNSKTKFFD